MAFTNHDSILLRELAKQVADIASQPVMARRLEMWKQHNSLRRVRPMILVFPEGSWRELLPRDRMECEDTRAREMEWQLRSRIYHYDHIHDDIVIEREWVISRTIHNTGWGLQPRHRPSDQDTGAWAFDPVITSSTDLKKLKFPEVIYDEAADMYRLQEEQELFNDILEVKIKGVAHMSFHPMAIYTQFRGLDQVMVDMYENPEMLHDAMAFFEEGYRRLVGQYIELNLLSLNNDSTFCSSGGNGYTDELPKPDFDSQIVRPCDMWASAESQELALVSPEMHYEFAWQYEKRLLEPFGLTGYGCCEDLTRKLDYILEALHMRRISVAPSANIDQCAEKIGDKCILSWKPQPAHLVGKFDTKHIRDYIKHALDVSQDCVMEMILKDTHTCQDHPERFTIWTDIARELSEAY